MTVDRLSNAFRTINGLLLTLGSAARVADAVNSRRTPAPKDLDRLGIPADAFASIGRF